MLLVYIEVQFQLLSYFHIGILRGCGSRSGHFLVITCITLPSVQTSTNSHLSILLRDTQNDKDDDDDDGEVDNLSSKL